MIYIDYMFDWYDVGWNNFLEVAVIQDRVGLPGSRGEWEQPVPRRLYDTANFSHIDTLVVMSFAQFADP